MSNIIQLAIQAAQAGGLAVFEHDEGAPSMLVFSGNLSETTEYLNGRMAELLSVNMAEPSPAPTTMSQPSPAAAYRPTFRRVPLKATSDVRPLGELLNEGE